MDGPWRGRKLALMLRPWAWRSCWLPFQPYVKSAARQPACGWGGAAVTLRHIVSFAGQQEWCLFTQYSSLYLNPTCWLGSWLYHPSKVNLYNLLSPSHPLKNYLGHNSQFSWGSRKVLSKIESPNYLYRNLLIETKLFPVWIFFSNRKKKTKTHQAPRSSSIFCLMVKLTRSFS